MSIAASLMVSHPSLTGLSSGSGTSGSTGWHNSVRSRMYFKAANSDGEDALENGLRELIIRKTNYGPSGEAIRLYYDGGVFKPVSSPSSIESRRRAEGGTESMVLFYRLVSQTPENYTSKVFSTHPEGKDIWPKAGAMERLLNAVTIKIENVLSQKRLRNILVRT
jgi:hypothetical protein